MNKSVAFIINPESGFGQTGKRMKTIVKEIKHQRFDAKIIETYHSLHAISLAKDALNKGIERIVVVGGDGTLNEVVNGFFDHQGNLLNKNACLAVIPSGRGADFVRTLGVARNLKASIELALNGQPKPCDVGLVEARDAHGQKVSRHFINVSSLGISGLVAGFMRHISRRFGPTAAYFMATVQAIRAFNPPRIALSYPDQAEQIIDNCSLIAFANGQYYGSGMKIAPHALIDDGLLDLISVNNLNLKLFLLNSYKVYRGTHLDLEQVSLTKVSECFVRSPDRQPVYIETDGELFAELPARYSIKHNILSLVR